MFDDMKFSSHESEETCFIDTDCVVNENEIFRIFFEVESDVVVGGGGGGESIEYDYEMMISRKRRRKGRKKRTRRQKNKTITTKW